MFEDSTRPIENPVLAVLASGGASTMAAVADAIEVGRCGNAKIGVVVASELGIGAITKAENRGIPCAVCSPKGMTQDEYSQGLLGLVRGVKANVVMMLGHLPLLPECFISNFGGPIYNQHPGKLDPEHDNHDFGKLFGLQVHLATLIYSIMRPLTHTEATIHEVTPNYDEGRVVGRRPVEIYPSTEDTDLAMRVLPIEHELVISVVAGLSIGLTYSRREFPLIPPEDHGLLEKIKDVARVARPHG